MHGDHDAMNAETAPSARPSALIHLVPHTHWDREWYEPFQVFRMRLVELVDHVLERMAADDRFCFTLDGQLATVDDYLEARPEAEPLIRRFVAEGRLAIGPWQILMDEFLVSGETMVRNLELGRQRALELGAVMDIGYLPDMFGHIAQMPQMLRRAGISDAAVWRGVPAAIDRHAFTWEAPDGSRVRTEYLVGGYGAAAHLFAIPERLPAKVVAFHELQRPFYGDGSLLAMYGTDHAVPAAELLELVDGVNAAGNGHAMRVTTLPDYLGAARANDDAASAPLPHWRGELRSGARANILMGVTSARIDLKQACGRAERWLERYAEPLAALHGRAWPSSLLRIAWRKVIENSAHDSICGCSLDPVVDQVLSRFAEAEQIGRGVAERAVRSIAQGVARGSSAVVNPSPRSRSGMIEFDFPIPDEWDEVALELPDGTTVGTQERSRNRSLLHETEMRATELSAFLQRRVHGRELFGRMLTRYAFDESNGRPRLTLEVEDGAESEWLDVDELKREVEMVTSAVPDAWWRLRVLAVPRRRLAASLTVPPLGWTSLRPTPARGDVDGAVRVTDRELDNGRLRVAVETAGTLRIESDHGVLAGVGRLVDGGDYGDSYNYGPPRADLLVERPEDVRVEVVAAGPVEGELVVTRLYRWPAGVHEDGSGRTQEMVEIPVRMRVALRAGEPFLRLRLDFENRARDHRLRFHVPLARAAETSAAEGQFVVVERGRSMEGGHGEVPLPTFPAHGWLDAGGCAVLLEHVMEYELVDAAGGSELVLTVLRATGLISRNDNPYREDPAGPERPIPAAQCRRDWSVGFALYPHPREWGSDGVHEMAERFALPFLATPGSAADEAATPEGHGLSVEGAGVVLSALKRRDDWVELRLVAEDPAPTRAVVSAGITEARDADLLGRPGGALAVADGAVTLDLGPWEIRTIQFRRSGGRAV